MFCTKCEGAGMVKADEKDELPTVACDQCNRTGEQPEDQPKSDPITE